jgi:hypothetical protein
MPNARPGVAALPIRFVVFPLHRGSGASLRLAYFSRIGVDGDGAVTKNDCVQRFIDIHGGIPMLFSQMCGKNALAEF